MKLIILFLMFLPHAMGFAMEPTPVYVEFAYDGSLHIRDRFLTRLDDDLPLVAALLLPLRDVVERQGTLVFPKGNGNFIAPLVCSNYAHANRRMARKIYRAVLRTLTKRAQADATSSSSSQSCDTDTDSDAAISQENDSDVDEEQDNFASVTHVLLPHDIKFILDNLANFHALPPSKWGS